MYAWWKKKKPQKRDQAAIFLYILKFNNMQLSFNVG